MSDLGLATSALISVVLACLALAIARFVRKRNIVWPRRFGVLDARVAPWLAGLVSSLLVWFVWGSLREPPIIHDERAYVLQAEIFASGRWTAPAPPLPEFFEQVHVFVEPHLAAKYPPGHALLLAPGVWLGMPGLVPVLLSGVTGALLFVLARHVGGAAAAWLAVLLWATSTQNLYWRAAYFSETTTSALWLLALVALVAWRSRHQTRYLLVIVAALCWAYLTRPLTALALGLPLGAAVLWSTWQQGRMRSLAIAMLLVAPTAALLLVWQQATVGDWRRSPFTEYARLYIPWDKPGFGLDTSAAVKPPSPTLQFLTHQFEQQHAEHVIAALPQIAMDRVSAVFSELGDNWRLLAIPLFVLGAIRATGVARLMSVSAALLGGFYLIYSHPAWWTLYYVEGFPVFFLIVALEIVRGLERVQRGSEQQLRVAAGLLLLLMVPLMASDVAAARQAHNGLASWHRGAQLALAPLDGERTLVFVKYPPDHNFNFELVGNSASPASAPMWLVYDRGQDNERLLRLTDRAAYVLDIRTWQIAPVARATPAPTAEPQGSP